jgi:hypothetical protein
VCNYRFRSSLVVLLLLLGATRVDAATSLTLAWDASLEQVAGYVVHVGTAPGTYSQHIDVGPATSFVYQPAAPGQRYCFAVSAYVAGPTHGPKSTEQCGYADQIPVLVSPGNQSSVIGQSDALQLQGRDPDGRPVTFTATSLPAGLSLTPSTGFISGTPTRAQTVNVTASVSDGQLSSTRSFTWTVQPPLVFTGLSADRAAPQATNTPITFTAASTGGAAPYQYRWWLHDGTNWQMLRDWTTSATLTWTPSAANANYWVTVWVKDANSTTTTWDVTGSIAFPIAAPWQVAMSANRASPQLRGAPITFTAAASGGKAPYQYRWWIYDGTSWQMARDWTTNATFTWTPTVANANYSISVWVKNEGSPTTTWDGSASLPFAIQ